MFWKSLKSHDVGWLGPLRAKRLSGSSQPQGGRRQTKCRRVLQPRWEGHPFQPGEKDVQQEVKEAPKARAHFFNLIEEDKLKAFGRRKRNSQRRGNGRLGRPNYLVEASTSPPPPNFFSDGCARSGAFSALVWGFKQLYYFYESCRALKHQSLPPNATTCDPRHRVLGARGRRGLRQGHDGLGSLVGRAVVSNQMGLSMVQAI